MYEYTVAIPAAPPPAEYSPKASFLEELITVACECFDVQRAQLYEANRTERVKCCRWTIWEIMWAMQNMTLSQVGNLFRSYDHASVIHALKTLPVCLSYTPYIEIAYRCTLMRMGIGVEQVNAARRRREAANKIVYRPHREVITMPEGVSRPLSQTVVRAKLRKLAKSKMA